MCLVTNIKGKLQESQCIESGWKYFNGWNSDKFPHQTWNGLGICPLDTWIAAEIKKAAGVDGGFHVFTDEKEAKIRYSKVRRVYFRRVSATGIDDNIQTVVAQELYVPSRQDDWPT